MSPCPKMTPVAPTKKTKSKILSLNAVEVVAFGVPISSAIGIQLLNVDIDERKTVFRYKTSLANSVITKSERSTVYKKG